MTVDEILCKVDKEFKDFRQSLIDKGDIKYAIKMANEISIKDSLCDALVSIKPDDVLVLDLDEDEPLSDIYQRYMRGEIYDSYKFIQDEVAWMKNKNKEKEL